MLDVFKSRPMVCHWVQLIEFVKERVSEIQEAIFEGARAKSEAWRLGLDVDAQRANTDIQLAALATRARRKQVGRT